VIYTNRGNVLAAFKRYDDAIQSYERAIALKPDYSDAWLGQNRVLVALKRCDDALASSDRAIALNPDDLTCGSVRVMCWWQR